jgi:glycosyltransferase involved in cell wall biosynthesis
MSAADDWPQNDPGSSQGKAGPYDCGPYEYGPYEYGPYKHAPYEYDPYGSQPLQSRLAQAPNTRALTAGPYCRDPYGNLVSSGESRPADLPGALPAPLRIIHVGQSLMRVGGIEVCLKGLIRFLDPRRARLVKCIVTPTVNFDPAAAAELGAPVEVGGAETVQRAVDEADVFLCWGPRDLGDWLATRRPKLCVFVAHGEGFWTRWILEGCAHIIDHVVAVSQRVKDKVCHGFASTVVPNGVDATHLAPSRAAAAVRAELGFAKDDFVLGYAGRFSPEKRAHLLIEAVARLPSHFKAVLVGAGPLRTRLMELANALIPGRYAFVTAVNTMGDYYAAMDALCLPSEEEGYAMVIAEAMLCGKPVIATAVGCAPEVFQDRINGLIVEGSPGSIGEAAKLLERHPEWRRGLAAEAHAFAQKHCYASTMARRYEELILSLWQGKYGAAGRA